jgi:putative membrane protein
MSSLPTAKTWASQRSGVFNGLTLPMASQPVYYYMNNPFFWLKMAAFLFVALLSIDPTIRYIRWNRTLRQNNVPEISEPEYKRTRLLLWLEIIGIAVILLAAPLMARGIGMN